MSSAGKPAPRSEGAASKFKRAVFRVQESQRSIQRPGLFDVVKSVRKRALSAIQKSQHSEGSAFADIVAAANIADRLQLFGSLDEDLQYVNFPLPGDTNCAAATDAIPEKQSLVDRLSQPKHRVRAGSATKNRRTPVSRSPSGQSGVSASGGRLNRSREVSSPEKMTKKRPAPERALKNHMGIALDLTWDIHQKTPFLYNVLFVTSMDLHGATNVSALEFASDIVCSSKFDPLAMAEESAALIRDVSSGTGTLSHSLGSLHLEDLQTGSNEVRFNDDSLGQEYRRIRLPQSIVLCLPLRSKTLENVRINEEFAINLASTEQVLLARLCQELSGNDIDKAKLMKRIGMGRELMSIESVDGIKVLRRSVLSAHCRLQHVVEYEHSKYAFVIASVVSQFIPQSEPDVIFPAAAGAGSAARRELFPDNGGDVNAAAEAEGNVEGASSVPEVFNRRLLWHRGGLYFEPLSAVPIPDPSGDVCRFISKNLQRCRPKATRPDDRPLLSPRSEAASIDSVERELASMPDKPTIQVFGESDFEPSEVPVVGSRPNDVYRSEPMQKLLLKMREKHASSSAGSRASSSKSPGQLRRGISEDFVFESKRMLKDKYEHVQDSFAISNRARDMSKEAGRPAVAELAPLLNRTSSGSFRDVESNSGGNKLVRIESMNSSAVVPPSLINQIVNMAPDTTVKTALRHFFSSKLRESRRTDSSASLASASSTGSRRHSSVAEPGKGLRRLVRRVQSIGALTGASTSSLRRTSPALSRAESRRSPSPAPAGTAATGGMGAMDIEDSRATLHSMASSTTAPSTPATETIEGWATMQRSASQRSVAPSTGRRSYLGFDRALAFDERKEVDSFKSSMVSEQKLMRNIGKDGVKVLSSSMKALAFLRELGVHTDEKSLSHEIEAADLLRGECRGHSSMVTCVRFHPEDQLFLATCSEDTTVRLWNVTGFQGRQIKCFREHTARVNQICFSPNGLFLISVADDGLINMYSMMEMELLERLPCSTDAPKRCCAVSPDGMLLAVGTYKRILLYDLPERVCIREIVAHKLHVYTLCFHHDDPVILASGGDDNMAKVWDLSVELGENGNVVDALDETSLDDQTAEDRERKRQEALLTGLDSDDDSDIAYYASKIDTDDMDDPEERPPTPSITPASPSVESAGRAASSPDGERRRDEPALRVSDGERLSMSDILLSAPPGMSANAQQQASGSGQQQRSRSGTHGSANRKAFGISPKGKRSNACGASGGAGAVRPRTAGNTRANRISRLRSSLVGIIVPLSDQELLSESPSGEREGTPDGGRRKAGDAGPPRVTVAVGAVSEVDKAGGEKSMFATSASDSMVPDIIDSRKLDRRCCRYSFKSQHGWVVQTCFSRGLYGDLIALSLDGTIYVLKWKVGGVRTVLNQTVKRHALTAGVCGMTTLFTVGYSKKIHMYNTYYAQKLAEIEAHNGTVLCIDHADKVRMLATGGSDNLVKLFSLRPSGDVAKRRFMSQIM